MVANHASTPGMPQLRMYIGGMAGTGKSQVIKAIQALFIARGEGFRFLILAPTGTAASLVKGSTITSSVSTTRK